MNHQTLPIIERISVYELADAVGFVYVERNSPVAAELAMDLLSYLLQKLESPTLTPEHCADRLFLLTFCTQVAVKEAVARLLAVPANTVKHPDVGALLLKLANLIWAANAGDTHYPGTRPEPALRTQFKNGIISRLSALPRPHPATLSFIANILDRHCTRTTQKLAIDSLTTYNPLPGLLAAQPSLLDCVRAELGAAFPALPAGFLLPDLQSVVFTDHVNPTLPVRTLATLIEGSQASPTDTATGAHPTHIRFRSSDATKAESVIAVSPQQYNHFMQRLKQLSTAYVETLNTYWARPCADNDVPPCSNEDAFVQALKGQLETEIRLLSADGSLSPDGAALIRQVIDHPVAADRAARPGSAHVKVVRLAIQNVSTQAPRLLSSVLAFMQDTPGTESTKAIVYSLHKGLEEFDTPQALKDEMNRRFNNRDELRAWLPCVDAHDYAETAFFSEDSPKKLRTQTLTGDAFKEWAADQRQKHGNDIQYFFKHATVLGLFRSPQALVQRLDDAIQRRSYLPVHNVLAARTAKLLDRVTPEEIARAFYIQQHPDQALPVSAQVPIIDLSAVFTAPPRIQTLTRDTEFRALTLEVFTSPTAQAVLRGVMGELSDYIPNAQTVSGQSALTLTHKCTRHDRSVPSINSRHYRIFFAAQQSIRNARFFSPEYHFFTSSLLLTDAKTLSAHSPEVAVQPHDIDKARQVSTTLSSTLHGLIGGGLNVPDLAALAGALEVDTLFPDPSIAGSGLQGASLNQRMTVLVDSPAFHRLETALLSAAPWTDIERNNATPSLIRALTVSALTDYLYPPANHWQGHLCGFNLNAPRLGNLTLEAVRTQLMEHLRSTLKCTSHQEVDLALGVLAPRYCPELLIFDAPHDLRYANSKQAIDFRHAVAMAELAFAGAAIDMGYARLVQLHQSTLSQTLTSEQTTAISVLRKTPVLHFAMCRGVIPFTPMADVTSEDVMTAFQYTTELEEEHARAMTSLVQPPPDRKKMALQQIAQHHPRHDLDVRRAFTEPQIHHYFVNRFKSRGRNMRMSLLEKYMTCGQDSEFDDQVLGFDTRGLAGCTLNRAFNTAYDTYQAEHRKALVVKLRHAINDLPAEQRAQLLSANHFLSLEFDVENNWNYTPCYFGLLAVSTHPTDSYVYEVFCPSGTIRKVAPNGEGMAMYASFDPSGILRTGHTIEGLPQLDVDAYTTGMTGSTRGRPRLTLSFTWEPSADMPQNTRVQRLSELMVDKVFSLAITSARPLYAHVTPYEAYKNELVARTELIFRVIIPFYSLYRDIENDEVTAATLFSALLEILAFVLPFGKALFSGYRASLILGKIVVRSTSFGVSRAALLSMRAAYGSRAFVISLSKGIAQAANPFALVGLLFQGGLKGLGYLQRTLLLREKLKTVPALAHLRTQLDPGHALTIAYAGSSIQPTSFGPLQRAVNPFKPDFSWGIRKLDVRQQQRFHQPDVDLSTATYSDYIYHLAGKDYIKMQGNVFALAHTPGSRVPHIYNGDQKGPAVRFDTLAQEWELVVAGLAGGSPPRAQPLTRQISLPMDGIIEIEGAYMVSYKGYVLPVAYDAHLQAWRHLRDKSLGEPVWRSDMGQWEKGSVDAFNTHKSRTPTPTRLKSFTFPTLPKVPENAVAIPNNIHYIWIGTRAPELHLISNIATNLTRSPGFISTLHLDVSASLFETVKQLCNERAPGLIVSKLQDEPFYAVFKTSPNAEQYALIKESASQLYASACDVVRFPLTNYYGGIYMDLDDVIKGSLNAAELKAAPDDLLLGNLVTLADINFHGYNSSHFATQPNNPVMTAISTEMHNRFMANKTFYLKPRPTLDEQLSSQALEQARKEYQAYFETYFRLTGPTLLNDVLSKERRVCYETAFQAVQGKTVFEQSSVADAVYLENLNTAFDHYFPFARKFEIDTGSEHSWKTAEQTLTG